MHMVAYIIAWLKCFNMYRGRRTYIIITRCCIWAVREPQNEPYGLLTSAVIYPIMTGATNPGIVAKVFEIPKMMPAHFGAISPGFMRKPLPYWNPLKDTPIDSRVTAATVRLQSMNPVATTNIAGQNIPGGRMSYILICVDCRYEIMHCYLKYGNIHSNETRHWFIRHINISENNNAIVDTSVKMKNGLDKSGLSN